MIQENELVTLVLSVGVLIFLVLSRSRFRAWKGWKLFVVSFGLQLAGWALTVLEGFIWPVMLNLLEHVCYAASAVALAVWCWRMPRRAPETTQ